MSEHFTQQVKVPKNFVIPAPWLVALIVTALINAGIVYQQFVELKDSFKESKTELAQIKERQVGGLARIGNLEAIAQGHESRITRLENQMLDAGGRR